MEHATRRLLLTLLLIGGTATGCSESDPVNRTIGTTLVYFSDPGLQTQGFSDIDSRVQAVDWDVQEALLNLDDMELDLRFGEACLFTDSAITFPIPEGKCGGGIVIDSTLEPVPITLDVTFTMLVKRARPPDSLVAGADFDGDGRPNDGDGSGTVGDAPCTAGTNDGCDDNCVLEFNPDQQDADGNGIGDTCSLIDPFTGNVSRDSDLDGVPDNFDNCLWNPNPFQTDSSGSIPDGIGDACEQEELCVGEPGNTDDMCDATSQKFTITREINLAQPLLSISFLTIDFNDAVTCDWDSRECLLDEGEVEFCVQNSVTRAAFGCF